MMPIYTVQGPDGRTYKIEGPEGATAEQLGRVIMAQQPKTPDPTEGMSTSEKLFAGIGKGMTDVGRGLGQMVGLVDRKDIEEARKRDAALMNTGAGAFGNVVGNVAAMLPTALIPGAATLRGATMIGAGSGLAAPSTSTEERLKNIGLGAVVAPAAILTGRGLASGYQAAKGLVEPFTKSGQEAIAARTLQQFAGNPTVASSSLRNAAPLVPGSRPTMAQASGDAGLAQLERTLRNNPETGALIEAQLASQRAARLKAVQDIAGTDDFYNLIKEGRSTFAAEDYAKAMANGIDPQMAKALGPQIKNLMERPSIQQAKQAAQNLAREQNISIDKWGSIEGLDWLKKGLDDLISSAKKPGSSIGDARLRALVQTKKDLMSVIEDVAPNYKLANDNFAAMSQQVNSMDVARGLLDRMQSPLARAGASQREMKNEFARALEQSMESTKRSTGMDLPIDKVMLPNDVATLKNVVKDMARSASAEDAGRAVGSNTAQNLAAQNLLRRTLGPTGLPQTWAESNMLQGLLAPYTGLTRIAGSDRAVMERLANAALDPQDAASLLLLQSSPSRLSLIAPEAMRYAPATAAGLLR
jgi:hypothetical protein